MNFQRGAVILAGTALAAAAQQAVEKPPAFEAASIKMNPSPALRHVLLPPVGGRLNTRNAPLSLLIQNAYAVQAFQILGGPDWINTVGYDVEAVAEGNPSRSQVWLMLRTLLEDRFKLKVRHETRELSGYALSVAKNAPKGAKAECSEATSPGAGPCGSLIVGAESGVLFVRGRQVTMADLIKTLAAIVQAPVIDRAGITGKFDVDLKFIADDTTVGLPSPGKGPEGPSILAALTEQLGLKLGSGKGPVEVIVIDHVERPSEN